ncbi:MAG: 2-hydroxy-3-oxopropionate reductase [Rhodospirillaceae bacterium]|jgi:2-hydroxy-3-oxopropionate reductase|nr:2-hydroxy-3-oxopropionate reductase [Rhodospirillaceae bacterium]
MNIGFVGLGIMGAPMASHLIDGGHQITTCIHNTPAPSMLVNKGLTIVDSLEEVARNTDIIIIMVPDTPQVQEVLFGQNGITNGLSNGKLVIDMSSISPIETKQFSKTIKAKGCGYLDAPVSGGELGAKAASLTIMVGGSEADFSRALPIFELMGSNITLVGENGIGQTTKVANQIVVALTIEAVGEALIFASKAGADPSKVRQALMGGLAQSRILEVHGERMIKRTFDPGFRIELHQKDLNLALQGAKSLGVSLPNTAITQELFNSCTANGDGALDHSGIITALERMSNSKVN